MCSSYVRLWLFSTPTLKWMKFGVEFLKYIYIYITGNLGQCTLWWFFAKEKKTKTHPYDSTWWVSTQINSHIKMNFLGTINQTFIKIELKLKNKFEKFCQYFNPINWSLDSLYYLRKIDFQKFLQNKMLI